MKIINKTVNKKFVIGIITSVFMILFLLNIFLFSYLKQHEKELQQNFTKRMELLSRYWETIFRADELELITPGSEYETISVYYQNLLLQLREDMETDDIKIVDMNRRLLVDHNLVYEIGSSVEIDSAFWENTVKNIENLNIVTDYQSSPPCVKLLLPLKNSQNIIKAVLYLQIRPPYLQHLSRFTSFIYFYNYTTLIITLLFGLFIVMIFIKYSEISEKRHREERLIQLGQLAATVAHEIRNPLGIIKGSTGMLKKVNEKNKRDTLTEYIEDEINRLDNMINRLLEFVKVPQISPAEVDLPDFCHALIEKYREQYPEIRFFVKMNPIIIITDRNLLRQILVNIINNSVHAVQSDCENPEIVCEAYQDKRTTAIHISNNGPAIPEKILDNLFTPFFTTKDKGSGLGLAICKTLTEALGGNITINNLKDNSGVLVKIVMENKVHV